MENQPQLNVLADLKDVFSNLLDIFKSEPKVLATKPLANDLVSNVLSNLLTVTEEPEITEKTAMGVLNCISRLTQNQNLDLSPNLLKKIIKALIDTDIESESLTTEHRQLVSHVLKGLHIQMKKCSGAEAASLLDPFWTNQFQFIDQMLVEFFDVYKSFLGSEQCQLLLLVIKQLIQSKEQEQRQMGYHLMKELEKIFNINEVVSNELKCTLYIWSLYIYSLERLEDQTIKLELNNLLIGLKNAYDFSAWLHILFIKLLQSDDISIRYKTITFIVKELNFSHLTHWNVVDEFLVATNCTELYNIDDSYRSDPFFKIFISKCENINTFMEIFINVAWEWNFIPLYEWLSSLVNEKAFLLEKDLLLKIISHVHRSKICLHLRYHIELLLQSFWDPLTLEEVIDCIKKTYKKRSIYFLPYCELKEKVVKCDNFETLLSSLNKSSLDVLFKTWTPESFVIAAMDKLKDVDKSKHGWLRFHIMSKYNYNQKIRDFYSSVYGVDSSLILGGKDLAVLEQHLLDKLMCQTDEEESFVIAIAIDLYVENQLDEWSNIEEMELKPFELLNLGGKQTLKHLAELIAKSPAKLKDDGILSAIINMVRKYPCCDTGKAIGKYAMKHLSIEEQCKISGKLLGQQEENFGTLESGIKVSLHIVIKGLLHCGPLTGDEWIEMMYMETFTIMPNLYLDHVLKQSSDFQTKVVNELLRINMKLSESNPEYAANSMEHRLKFRIVSALLVLQKTKYQCITQVRLALKTHHEQFNIRCFYEMIMARILPNMDSILSELNSLSIYNPHMQLSILSVAHIYLIVKQWNLRHFDKIEKIFQVFLTLTMDNDFEIRQFSKFVIHNLIEKCDRDRCALPIANSLKACIKANTAGKLVDPKLRARLLLPKLYKVLSQENKIFSYYGYTFNMSNVKTSYELHNAEVILGARDAFKAVSKEALKEISPTD
ncbi:uncharacterized protein [Drosophila tropicalis]|uniref:uncharacterized protein n=1 Tax=Drosophila tropicalis TaxID=46794 RepID=UPI0035ABCD96